MADNSFKTGDNQYNILRKMLATLAALAASGGTGGGPATIADGADTAEGAKADAANTDSTSSWSVISLLKGIWAKLNGGVAVTGTLTGITNPVAVTSAGLTNLDVALSTRLKPADTLAAVTSITNPVAVTSAGLTNLDVALSTRLKPADTLAAVTSITNAVTVAQATAANLKVDLSGTGANATALKVDGSAVTQPVSGNVGGKTAVIKDASVVTASAYSAGNAVGAKRTLANALTAVGTGVLESIIVLDRANQKAPLDIFIFDADPTNATITDHAAFVFSTDDLKVIAHVSVAAADYVTVNSKAVAHESSLGIALKASGTSLYAAVVTSGTPTYAATTDVQVTFGILQD